MTGLIALVFVGLIGGFLYKVFTSTEENFN